MKVITHTFFSSCVLALSGASWWQALLISLFFPNLCDVDHVKSMITRVFRLHKLSLYIMQRYRHRTITHSLISQIAVAFVTLPVYFISPQIYGFIQISYYSHIFIDKLNKEGVYWLYPLKKKVAFPLRKKVRVRVGSGVEYFLLVCFFCIQVVIFANGTFNLKQSLLNVTGSTFQRYITAQEKYKANIGNLCYVKVLANEDKLKRNVTYYGPMLSIDKERVIFLQDGAKHLILKDNVMEIEVFVDKVRKVNSVPHIRNVKDLANTNGLLFVSGDITINNAPKILLSDLHGNEYVKYENKGDGLMKITLTYAALGEISHLIEFDSKIRAKKMKLMQKSPLVEKANLERQRESLEKEREILTRSDEDPEKFDEAKRRENSKRISEIEKLIQRLDSNILGLGVKIQAGKDGMEEVDEMDNVEIFYDLTLFDYEVEK